MTGLDPEPRRVLRAHIPQLIHSSCTQAAGTSGRRAGGNLWDRKGGERQFNRDRQIQEKEDEALVEISEGFGAIEIPQQSLHAPVAEARSPDPPFIQSPARQTINQTPPLSVCVCVSLTA